MFANLSNEGRIRGMFDSLFAIRFNDSDVLVALPLMSVLIAYAF